MKFVVSMIAALLSSASFGQSADAAAGTCVGYMIMTKRDAGAEVALNMSVDKSVAAQHAKIFIMKWKNNGPDLSGGAACRVPHA